MKHILILLLTFLACRASAQKLNFTGDYEVDLSKTDFGTAPQYVLPKKIKIEQANDKIIISRVQLDQNLAEQKPIVDTLTFDGKSFSRKNTSGTLTSSKLSWADNNTFKVEINGKSNTIEIWKLDISSHMLVLDRTVDQNDGFKYRVTGNYTKLK